MVNAAIQKQGDKINSHCSQSISLATGKHPLITTLQIDGGGEILPHLFLKKTRRHELEAVRFWKMMGLARGTLTLTLAVLVSNIVVT